MIKPNHECAWSHEHSSSLHLRAGYYGSGGQAFSSAGTSLPALMEAFRDEPLRWYTRAYGDVHQGEHENLLLIAVDAAAPVVAGAQQYADVGPLSTGLHGAFRVREYVLGDVAAGALGLKMQGERLQPADWTRFRYYVHLHDDCFGYVEPVDRTLLVGLVRGVLGLHSYYLGQDVNWSDVPFALVDLLGHVGKFELRGSSEAGVILVDWPHQAYRREKGGPVKPYLGRITIREGVGDFEAFAISG